MDTDLTARIVAFLNTIGIVVRAGTAGAGAVLPGIEVVHGGLVSDPAALTHPGDLLHEAGHLAVAPPERRAGFHADVGNDPAEEMMAIAWSYAAALHIGIDPVEVFHAAGYRGGGASILENFAAGHFIGLPMLQYTGMALDKQRAAHSGVAPYPHMLRWLREAEAPIVAP
jgi:hypothetical protein